MKRVYIKPVKGFTLVEVMISIAIISIIVVSGYDFFDNAYKWGRKTFLQILVYTDMQRKAIIGLEKMVHGIEEHKGIQEAQEVTHPEAIYPATGSSDSTITFQSKDDGSLRSFSLSGDDVEYADGTVIIDDDVDTLTFTKRDNDWIQIYLKLVRTPLDETIEVKLTTSVKLRNR